MGKISQETATEGFEELEKRIGHRFADRRLPEKAFTHASYRSAQGAHRHYERLEFLGDRVLGLCIAEMLYVRFPEASEGELAVRLNQLVNGQALAEISDELQLHEFIRAGPDTRSLTHKRMKSVRADVLEALIASIYLDGGLTRAREFVEHHWSERMNRAAAARPDPKTQLQEWAHARRLGTPAYRQTDRAGPDHEPQFTVRVELAGLPSETGMGRSKRAAEQDAASRMLQKHGGLEDGQKDE